MKKIALPLVLLLALCQLFAQTVPVTFHYDTRNTSVKTVTFFSGGFENTVYTDDDQDSIFEITVEAPQGQFGYLPLSDNAYMWDPHNPKNFVIVSDPMITYLLPYDGSIMKEKQIRADLAFTEDNSLISGSLILQINNQSVAEPEQYYNAEKRLLILDNPPYLVEGENSVTLSYSTNKGSISATSVFTYHSIQIMCDTTTYYIPDCPFWGRVFNNSLPSIVYVKHNDKVLEAPVNVNGYFCVNTELVEGDNEFVVAASEAELENPVNQTILHANLCPQFWVELNGSVNGNTATITVTAHDAELSDLTLQWSEENSPKSIGINTTGESVSFSIPEQEGIYTIKLTSTDQQGKTYTARECLIVNENSHFLGIRERAPWMENMVMYQLNSGNFWGYDNGFRFNDFVPVFEHFNRLGINTLWLTNLHDYGMIGINHFEFGKFHNETSGSKEDFKRFVQKAHEYGIKIIPQISFTHTAPLHSYLLQSYLNKDASVFSNFYEWEGEPGNSEVITLLQGRNCVSTNLDNEFTEEYFLRNLEYWIEEFDVDGVFYDCGNEASFRSPGFMQKALERQKNKKPDFFIFSEGDATIQPYSLYHSDGCYDWMLSVPWDSKKGFPGIFNQTTNVEDLDSVFIKTFPDSLLIKRKAADYDTRVHEIWDLDREKLGLSMVMTAYGLPHIWMGDEIGSDNILGPYSFVYDPENLKPLYARLIKMRQGILGNFAVLTRFPNNSPQQVYSYISKGKEGTTLTVANLSSMAASVTINLSDNLFDEKITKWYEVMGDADADLNAENTVTISLNKWESKVFVLNKTKSEIYTSLFEPEPVAVTFQVNMKGIDVNHGGVSVVGNWSNWKEATQLSLVKDDIYAGTIVFETFGELQWRFANTIDVNDYDNYEYLGSECTKNYNRYLELQENDTILTPVCFGTCNSCGYNTAVTFKVNMQNETVSGQGVCMMGSWDNWTTKVPLNNTVEKIYSATLSLVPDTYVEYKFVNGDPEGEWGTYTWEEFSGICTNEWTNRVLNVTDENITLPAVCFNSCDACPTTETYTIEAAANPTAGGTVSGVGTFDIGTLVKISAEANFGYEFVNWTNADTVYSTQSVLVFNLYNDLNLVAHFKEIVSVKYTITTSFTPSGAGAVTGAGTYDAGTVVTITATPKDGYSFVNWTVKGVEVSTSASYTFTIDKSAAYLAHFAKASELVNVTFQVDMQNEEVGSSGVYLNGSFCSWNPSDAVRLEENGSVYSSSLQLKKGETIEYKFVNGAADNWAKYELLPGLECAFGKDANRGFIVPDHDIVLDVVCFGACSTCVPVVVSDSVNVTFQVDMQNEEVGSSGVYLNGSFCSWNPSDAVRLEENGSVYSSSLQLKKGETIEYKFVNGAADNWAKYELLPGLECAFGNDANRALVVPDYDLLLDLVCFESCSVCKTNSVVEYISESITVSPNPAKDELNIRGLNFGTNKIKLCSIDGQVLKMCTVIDVDNYVISISAVLPGVYYLIIIDSDNKAETFKILIE